MRRNLILGCALALSLMAGWLIFNRQAGAASSIIVTTTDDVIASDSWCSLREAIIAANTDSAFNDCPAGTGKDTITFSPALPTPSTFVLTLTGSGENNTLTGDLDIVGSSSNTLAINGLGPENTIIDGNGLDRIFDIHKGARATISAVTVQNGNPGATHDGGGIAVRSVGRLTVNNSLVTSNRAVDGGGIHVLGLLYLNDSTVEGNYGGGVHNTSGILRFTNAQILNNTHGFGVTNEAIASLTFTGGVVKGNQGGGVFNRHSSAALSGLEVINNTVDGGVYNEGASSSASLTIRESSVMSNTGGIGAGIYNKGLFAKATIENVRISFNTATAGGGGINNNGDMTLIHSLVDQNQAHSGGGINNRGVSLDLINVTISNNSVADNGGGLYNRSSATLENVTLNGNSASGADTGANLFNEAEITLLNTIVANPGLGPNCFNDAVILDSLGHNLEDDDTCGLNATGDITNTNPLLGPLADNGGPTFTHALLPGSPAIDSGDGTQCPATDQRGVDRPQAAGCDIGALESALTADLSASKQRVGSGSIASGQAVTYTITITNAGPTTPITATVVDTWTPVDAVFAVSAPGCTVSLLAGTATCTVTNLGLGSAVSPDPTLVLTTSPTFSGTLTNIAQVSPNGGVFDLTPGNDSSDPVAVVVIAPPTYGVNLSPNESKSGTAGQTVNYTLEISNLGNVADTYDLVVSGQTWTTTLSTASVNLGAGAKTTFSAMVEIPLGALSGDSDHITVTATSQGDISESDAALLTTTVTVLNGVNISPDQAKAGTAGQTAIYTLAITNTGNVADTFDLLTTGNTWTTTLSTSNIPLDPGATAWFSVTVDIPAAALDNDTDMATITANSQGDSGKKDDVIVTTTVKPVYGVDLSPDVALSARPGEKVTYTLEITNTGKAADTFDLLASGHIWPTSLSAISVTLDAAAAATFTVTVDIPAGALGDDVDSVTVTVTSLGDGTKNDSALLTTGVIPVYAVELSGDDSLTSRPGTTVTYTLWITNAGNGADTIDLEVSGNVWTTTLTVSSIMLAAGERDAIMIAVSIPATAADFEHDKVTITAVSGHDGTKRDTAVLTTINRSLEIKLFLPLLFSG